MMQGQQAFTLLEMIVVVAIMAILLIVAYPYIQELFYAMESRRAEQAMVQILRQAKAESYTNKKDVVICTLDQMGRCRRGANTTLALFYDINANNQKDDADRLIYQEAWRLKHGDILLRTSLSRDYIRYMGDTAKPRGHIGHLRYCSVSHNPRLSFKVVFNMHGHVRVERADTREVEC